MLRGVPPGLLSILRSFPETKASVLTPSVALVSASVIVTVLFPAAESFLTVKTKLSPPVPGPASSTTLKFFNVNQVIPAKESLVDSVTSQGTDPDPLK